MSQFQTFIRSPDTPLNIQTLILVVSIDATMPMPELRCIDGKCTLYKQDTQKYSVDKLCCIFEDNYIFVENLILHPGHTSLFLETVTIKFGLPKAEDRHIGPRAEDGKKQKQIL